MNKLDTILCTDPQLEEHIKHQTTQFAGKIFSVHTLDVVLPDGSLGYREIVKHSGGAGVVAIQDGRLCLVRQYRVALGRTTLEIPAGKLENGEMGYKCAERELLEETGLVANSFELIATCNGSPGFSDEHTDIYLAKGLQQHKAAPEADEFLHVVWLPIEDVIAAIRGGKICDAKTVIGAFSVYAGLL